MIDIKPGIPFESPISCLFEDDWEKSSEKDKSSKSKLGSLTKAVLDCDWLHDGTAIDCDLLLEAMALDCDWLEFVDDDALFGGFFAISKLSSWLSWDVEVTGGSSRNFKKYLYIIKNIVHFKSKAKGTYAIFFVIL